MRNSTAACTVMSERMRVRVVVGVDLRLRACTRVMCAWVQWDLDRSSWNDLMLYLHRIGLHMVLCRRARAPCWCCATNRLTLCVCCVSCMLCVLCVVCVVCVLCVLCVVCVRVWCVSVCVHLWVGTCLSIYLNVNRLASAVWRTSRRMDWQVLCVPLCPAHCLSSCPPD